MTTDLETAAANYWCAAWAVRTGRQMTCLERIAAHVSLLELTASAPTDGLRRRAREACLNVGIVAPGFHAIPGGAA